MELTIVGTGYVGLTAGVCLANKGHNIICLDTNLPKIEKLKNGMEVIYEPNMKQLINKAIENKKIKFTANYKEVYNNSKIIILCVPTPEELNGSVNMEYINKAIDQISENIKNDCYIIIKSTVPVGTCDKILKRFQKNKYKINVIFNPEFLAQGEAVNNFLNPQRIVIGVNNLESKRLMEKIYKEFDAPKIFMDTKSAELSKYACNNFLALKLSYINELSNLCEKLEINVENILNVMKLDARIGREYLEPGLGYGGSCLTKDTKALAKLAKENEVQLNTIEAAISTNEMQKNKLIEKLDKYYINKKDLNIAILGLSFKENTNDLRGSQAIETIMKLKDKVNKIFCYDNKQSTLENAKQLFQKYSNIFFTITIENAIQGADVCMIFNKEKEILELSPDVFKKYMRKPLILDGKNCFNMIFMNDKGIKYDSIGRNINGKNN